MGRVTDRRPVVRIDNGKTSRRPDTLSVEEPLEIRVDGSPLAVTMRTPGDDVDLAHGFLLTEGIITSGADVAGAKHCMDTNLNVLEVSLRAGVPAPVTDPTRHFYMSSSCGTCGKASIDAVRIASVYPVEKDQLTVTPETLSSLPDRLRERQKAFDRTGGLHAAGLFTASGELLCVREDVGRHNAVDKVLGWALRSGHVPLTSHILMVSGRASFELTQKAALAGIPLLAAVSAPSTLAVDLANELGLTLVGFLRGTSMNVYSRADRIAGGEE
ncbi:formate dehydrogenase accessory sulfurtransferase FdhD [Longispora albida]|uniref:formate dehydrogenase accessory sulfurtransferase FdhD n=1 Tax=Longispora albida TaxID=203523 RepID=UPI00058BE9AB|nr:formate dehydrogenase accessory sulfurtransferase FdhD [Longispora albida]